MESASDTIYRRHPIIELEQRLIADGHVGDDEVHGIIKLEIKETEVLDKYINDTRVIVIEMVYIELDNLIDSSQMQAVEAKIVKMDRNW